MDLNFIQTGTTISGSRAKEIGFVLDAVPRENVAEEALNLCTSIATASRSAVKSALRSLRAEANTGLNRALQM